MRSLPQRPQLPSQPLPIVIIGCGGIVQNAHLPAYRAAGLHVAGVHDRDPRTSARVARRFHVEQVFTSLGDAVAEGGVVFDVAVPADQLVGVLRALPPRAAVLMQKPMGHGS
ncbi:MAG: Gfo/Idh/MocA family oxidoreductase [Planctomycetota bacterium]